MSDEMTIGFPKVYACVSSEDQIRAKSSSGGVFYHLASSMINQGGYVFGAGYDEKYNVIHKCINSSDALYDLMTSKYVQSFVGDAYIQTYELLTKGEKVLFCGTPCQTLGLDSFLSVKNGGKMFANSNLLTMEIMCFGVPSPSVWRKYLDHISHGRKLTYVNFREKINGKGVKNLRVCYEGGEYTSNYTEDSYYKAFSDALSLRKSCYNCDAKKSKRLSDIVLGDFWGIENLKTQLNHEKGVSAVIINTPKGLKAFEEIKNGLSYEEHSLNDVLKQNIYFRESVAYNSGRSQFFEHYK